MPPRIARIGAALAAAALLAACAPTSPDASTAGTPSPAATASKPPVLAALCDAASAAPQDPEAARATFFQRAHERLHELARAVADGGQRSTAGTLLQAKERVEAAFEGASPAPDLTARLTRLIDATRAALDADGQAAPPC